MSSLSDGHWYRMTSPDLLEVDSLIKALWLSSALSPRKVIIQEKKGALISDAGLIWGSWEVVVGEGGALTLSLCSDPSPAMLSWARQVIRPLPSPMPASTPFQVL